MPKTLTFELSATQTAFVESDAHIVQLIGPMGVGKTRAGIAGLIYHAARNGKDIETALVRDTFQNIKTSTLKDLGE
jgi:phage terminase large subunit-like protein